MWTIDIFLYGPNGKEVDFSTLPAKVVFAATTSVWFLWAIFWCSLAVLLINKYFKDAIIAYIALLAILIIMPDYTFQNHKFMYFYFVLAYLFNRLNIADKFSAIGCKSRWFINILLAVIYMGLFIYFDREDYIYTTGVSIWHVKNYGGTVQHQLLVDGYRYLIGLVGVSTVMLLIYNIYTTFEKVKELKLWNIICNIGQHSLEIYLINGIWLGRALTAVGSDSVNYFIFTVVTIIVILLSMMTGKVLSKNRNIQKILFGKITTIDKRPKGKDNK